MERKNNKHAIEERLAAWEPVLHLTKSLRYKIAIPWLAEFSELRWHEYGRGKKHVEKME